MNKKAARTKCFINWLNIVLIILFSTNFVFAQCGNYFKTNYRAVNKIKLMNGVYFKLDDWTGDGKSDFWNLKPNPNGLNKDILIYPSKADGYWDWDHPIVYNTSLPGNVETSTQYVVKDFNSDGKTDIFIYNRIYQNVNNETFIALPPVTEDFTTDLLFGVVDVNNDGLLDWINWKGVSGQVSIGYYPGTAAGAFGARVSIITNNELVFDAKALGDFNGDGKIDIAYGAANGYRVLLSTGGGTFSTGTLMPDAHTHSFLEVRDFNNDGKADILAKDSASTRLFILYGQANATFSETELPVYNSTVMFAKAAELNGDNNLDVIKIERNHYSVYINNGAGGFTKTDYQRSLVGNNVFPVIEDFSGDNKADFLNNNAAIGEDPFNAFFEIVVNVRENVCQPSGETKRANFDGSYYGDIMLWNGSGLWTWLNYDLRYYMSGSNTFGASGDVPAPGDYDGDGKTDYAVFRTSTGDWKISRSSDNAQVNLHFGLTGDIPVPNDYDGGGKTDICVFRPADGNWYIFSFETGQVSILHFGLNGDRPVPADYDGDDKTDLGVYRPSEGNWYYYRSSDQSIVILHWGIASDKPLPMDYDGDGKADIAVYRGGDWYILRSGSYSYNFIHWGTAGDIPVPIYRENHSAELMIYRPSTGYWYNYRRSAEYFPFNPPGSVPIYFGLPNN